MHAPHNAEGHFLSLRCPLDGLALGGCDGADIGASESLPLAGRASGIPRVVQSGNTVAKTAAREPNLVG
jgi:hypothetical protein